MRRIRELIAVVNEAHPKDRFFANIDTTLRASRQARAQYRAYGRALNCLDPQSWAELKEKAARHFLDHRKGQLKQGFFNQLNEAFAYEHLTRRGSMNRKGDATLYKWKIKGSVPFFPSLRSP